MWLSFFVCLFIGIYSSTKTPSGILETGPISSLRIWMNGPHSLEDLNPPLFLRLEIDLTNEGRRKETIDCKWRVLQKMIQSRARGLAFLWSCGLLEHHYHFHFNFALSWSAQYMIRSVYSTSHPEMALRIIWYNIDNVMNKNACSSSNKNIPAFDEFTEFFCKFTFVEIWLTILIIAAYYH